MSITYPTYREADSDDDGGPLRPDSLEDEFDDAFEDALRRDLIAAGLLDE